MKTKTLTISILLLVVVLAPLAMAEPDQRGPRGGREHRNFQGPRGGFGGHPGMGGFLLGRMADKLELTEAQRAEIKAITEGTRPEAEEAREAVREAMKALHEATANGTEAEIIAAGKAVGDTLTEQALLRAGTMKHPVSADRDPSSAWPTTPWTQVFLDHQSYQLPHRCSL